MAEGKTEQLLQALNKHVHLKVNPQDNSPSKRIQPSEAPKVFISYCWTNSHLALQEKQIKQVIGKFNGTVHRCHRPEWRGELVNISQSTSPPAFPGKFKGTKRNGFPRAFPSYFDHS